MTELDSPIHTLADITAAAGAKPNTLHNWFHRGLLSLGAHDKPAAAAGATTLVTGRTALAFGIALVLAKHEVPVERAIHAGRMFANSGVEGRRPGFLFAGPDVVDTWIILSKGAGRETVECSIVAYTKPMQPEDIIQSGSYGINSCDYFQVFPLVGTVLRLRQKLGLPEDRG
jgi:hypothetical protein